MALPTNTFTTYSAIGNREDLSGFPCPDFALAHDRTAVTITTQALTALGIISRNRMPVVLVPIDRAASTNSRSRNESTSLRVSLR